MVKNTVWMISPGLTKKTRERGHWRGREGPLGSSDVFSTIREPWDMLESREKKSEEGEKFLLERDGRRLGREGGQELS